MPISFQIVAWTGDDQIIVYDALGERSMLRDRHPPCKHLVTGGTEQRQFMIASFDKPRLKPGISSRPATSTQFSSDLMPLSQSVKAVHTDAHSNRTVIR